MIELLLIGIGAGNPDHLTGQAIKALNEADLILIPQKGAHKADLADLRWQLCRKLLVNPATKVTGFDLPIRDSAAPDYIAGVKDWHDAIADRWRAALDQHGLTQGKVALLVWGDPSLYDSSLRIAQRLGASVRVIPGLTSLQLLTAAHGIALNTLADPFLVTTGRKLKEHGMPAGIETVAVMLDRENSFNTLDPTGLFIYWGAYLGMPTEIKLAGPLQQTSPLIQAARAAARAEHGWIMDIYLIRRTRADQ